MKPMTREREKLADALTSLTGGILPEIEFEHLLSYVHDLVYPDQVQGLVVDWDLLPSTIKNDLREAYVGQEQGDEREEILRRRIALNSPREVLEIFLHYEGIVNFTGTILMAVNGIRSAARKK